MAQMQEYTTQRKAAMHFFPIEIIYQGSLYSPKKHFFFLLCFHPQTMIEGSLEVKFPTI